MTSSRIALVACALLVTPLLAQNAQNPMREGEWEVTVQMEMPGLPTKMPEIRTTQCITSEQLKDPASAIPTTPGSDCKVTDQKIEGNKVSWKMACTGAQAMTGDGELLFEGDTYRGTINANMEQGQMTMKMAGKRLGACSK